MKHFFEYNCTCFKARILLAKFAAVSPLPQLKSFKDRGESGSEIGSGGTWSSKYKCLEAKKY